MRQLTILCGVSLVLCVFAHPAAAQWANDYGRALQQAKSTGKPLLVIIENPDETTMKVEQVRHVKDASELVLLARYQLCYVDVRNEYGKRVAESFKAEKYPLTVIIDRTGSSQIFRKAGRFSGSEWLDTLGAYQHGLRRPQAQVDENDEQWTRAKKRATMGPLERLARLLVAR